MTILKDIPVWENVDYDCFHNEIVPLNQPAVIRSLVADWPLVNAAEESADSAVDYLKPLDKADDYFSHGRHPRNQWPILL